MRKYILECCVDSAESAENAVRGGANRLELCGNLVIGGTTPSFALFEQVRRETGIKIHVLIRPRFGDFCYTESELKIMRREIEWFRDAGADGIVTGILKPDGTLDVDGMKYLMEPLLGERGRGMKVTLHRAFDMCRNPEETLEQAVEIGVNTILTSGQQESAWKGRELLKKLNAQAAGRIAILAGGGITAEVIRGLYPVTQLTDYHMSGKVTLDSRMEYRKEEVRMGLPSLSEYDIWQTKAENVQAAKKVLEEFDADGLEINMK